MSSEPPSNPTVSHPWRGKWRFQAQRSAAPRVLATPRNYARRIEYQIAHRAFIHDLEHETDHESWLDPDGFPTADLNHRYQQLAQRVNLADPNRTYTDEEEKQLHYLEALCELIEQDACNLT